MPLKSDIGRRIGYLCLAGLGCSSNTELVAPPPPPPAAFTLTVLPEQDDQATSEALGWGGGIPGMQLSFSRVDATSPSTFTTSGAGTIAVTGLAAGTYTIAGERWLTPSERSRLQPGDDAWGYSVKATVAIAVSGGGQVRASATRQRSLLISEWGFNYGIIPGVSSYRLGGYIELFNNSDTTVYLDGIRVGEAYSLDVELPSATCSEQLPLKADPAYLWSGRFQRFPGGGRHYPLAAGEAVVVATDAIDHGPIIPDGLDLRTADFEFTGPADVDNPSVPNMIDDGLRSHPFGHGFYGGTLVSVIFVAAPVDLSQLPSQRDRSDLDYRGFPRARILDAAGLRSEYVSAEPECLPVVHSNFDRGPERLINRLSGGFLESAQRRLAAPANRTQVALLHSRNARIDFVFRPRNPGTVQP